MRPRKTGTLFQIAILTCNELAGFENKSYEVRYRCWGELINYLTFGDGCGRKILLNAAREYRVFCARKLWRSAQLHAARFWNDVLLRETWDN